MARLIGAADRGARDGLVVLALNAGSSSLKFGLFQVGRHEAVPVISTTVPIRDADARDNTGASPGWNDAIEAVVDALHTARAPAPDVVGHRIVHGGPELIDPVLIDDTVLGRLESARVLAPLHAPLALSVIRFAMERFKGVPQMACFDTAFHARMPAIARTLPVAREWRVAGVRRYGFHGLSCESIVRQLGDHCPRRTVIAHLGHGASVTAVKDGVSVDTSMGMTPSGGVIMGTRSGDLDPGVLLYLMREKGLDAAACEDVIECRSGLLGVSGVSSDLRALHREAAHDADARLAIQMFCTSVSKHIAAMGAVLGGIELLVFTGGIGEHDSEARASICDALSWAGIRLDPARNVGGGDVIGADGARCSVRVLPSREEQQIAHHAFRLVGQSCGATP